MPVKNKYECLSCKGLGKKGYIKGFIFSCPYCNGKGGYDTKKEQIEKGLCSRDVVNQAYQTNLFFQKE